MEYGFLQLIRNSGITALLLFTSVLHASSPLPEQIRSALEDELYPFSQIVPGYKKPATNPPKFAVAEFRTNDDSLLHWSQAIAEILRYKIQYIPGVRLYMPAPYNTFIDAQLDDSPERPLLTSQNNFKGLNKTLGIESVLTGSVESNGTTFTLNAEIVDVAKDGAILQKEWQFSAEELPATLIEISEWVYASLGVELSNEEHAYLKDKKSFSREAIEDFISLYSQLKTLKGPMRRDKINPLQEQHPNFSLFAIYTLHNRIYAQNLDEAYKNLELYKNLRSSYKGHAGIELESYRAMEIEVLPKHNVNIHINGLKDLLKEQPYDPTIMAVLADALVNNGSTLEGLAVLLESVERWPNYYRGWWSLGWALNEHAWQVRGKTMWRDVPELAKEKFKTLSYLANFTISEALTLNPKSASLWNLKIRTLGAIDGYSEELMNVFEKAIQLAPENKPLYSNALNFSTDKWGGNAEARIHIIESALKNNPEAPWPKVFRSRYADDFDITHTLSDTDEVEKYIKKFIDHPNIWIFAIIFIGIVFWFVFALGKQSGNNKIDNDSNQNID